MPQTIQPQNQHPRRLITASLLLGAFVCLFLLSRFLNTAPLAQINEQVGEASIHFSLDRSQVLLSWECVQASWSVEGIRAIYFNQNPTIGSGTQEICPWATQPSLRIIFQDDSERVYLLPVRVISYSPVVWGLAAIIMACILGAVRLNWRFGILRPLEQYARRFTQLWSTALNQPLLILTLVILAGAALRFTYIDTHALVLDEAAMWNISHGTLDETLTNNAYGNSAPPLFALLLWLWQVFGQSELWLRLLPVFASLAAIPTIYALVRRLFDRTTGYTAAVIMALVVPQTEYAQYLREYSLTVLLTTLALYAYFKLRQPKSRLIWISIWIVCLLTQYGLVLLIAALNLLWMLDVLRKPQGRVREWLSAQLALAGALALSYGVALRFQLGAGTGASWYNMFYWDGLPASLGSYALNGFNGLLTLSFGANAALFAFASLSAVGLVLIATERRTLLPVFVLPILAVLAAGILGYYPYTGARQMVFLTPLLIIPASAGLSYLVHLQAQAPLRWLASLLMIAGIIGSLTDVGSFYSRASFDQMPPVIETLKAARWETDEIFVIPPFIDSLVNYYYLSADPSLRESYTLAWGSTPENYGEQLDDLLATHQRVWVIMNCCSDGLMDYAQARDEVQILPIAVNGNIELYLLE
jgi:uncharacterized membrane protein